MFCCVIVQVVQHLCIWYDCVLLCSSTSPVWFDCCVASVVAQSIHDLYRPACCVGLRLAGLNPLWKGFFFSGGSLVTRCEAPDGFGAFSDLWLANYFPSVIWCCWLDLSTHKTVSRITCTVLVETLNPAISISIRCDLHIESSYSLLDCAISLVTIVMCSVVAGDVDNSLLSIACRLAADL